MAITVDPHETRAIAIAGMALSYALVGMLKRTSTLDSTAVGDTFEATLLGVENAFSPNDRAAALARQILDLMGGQLAAHLEPLGRPPERDNRSSRKAMTANSELARR
jgi:hypothetical protein